MNDLAEKALHGLGVARRHVTARPMVGFALLGLAASTVAMIAGGRVRAADPTRPLTTWFGLLDAHGLHADDRAPAFVMLAGVVALVALWVVVVAFVRRHAMPDRSLWLVSGSWSLPLLIGPPLLGTSVQSYAAFGLMQRHGLSPYDYGPSHLGAARVVASIEPAARGVPSSAGPLGSLVQHLAISIGAGSALGAVLVLRGVAVVATVLIGRFAAELAGERRTQALALTVLNPLVLLFVVSAARLDGLMVALLLAAIVAAGQRRWVAAVTLVCIAGSVQGQAFFALPAILVAHWLSSRATRRWARIGRDLLAAAATVGIAGAVVDDGFGWLWTVHKQFSAHTPYSIAGAIAKVLDPVVRGASYDDLAAGARITTITAMICIVGYLLITSRQRALERTVGYSLLALALLAPDLYPWYLLWGALCIAPTASGIRRDGVLALCAAGCILAPPGFSSTATNVVTGVGLAAVAVVIGLTALRRHVRAEAGAQPDRAVVSPTR